jgi:hypothetical protein
MCCEALVMCTICVCVGGGEEEDAALTGISMRRSILG